MKMRILCAECQHWTVTGAVDSTAWSCASCGFQTTAAAESASQAGLLETCRVCGNAELYVQKDFPHWLGMGILVIACVASVVTYAMHQIVLTWAILIGSAVLDGLLYLAMGNVVVCYRCRSHYRGFPISAKLGPFNLAIGEKHRQERLRREELGNRQ